MVIFNKNKILLDIFNNSKYRGSLYEYHPEIVLSSVGKTIQNNNHSEQSRKILYYLNIL